MSLQLLSCPGTAKGPARLPPWEQMETRLLSFMDVILRAPRLAYMSGFPWPWAGVIWDGEWPVFPFPCALPDS